MATEKSRKKAAERLRALDKKGDEERRVKRNQLRTKAHMGDRATRKKASTELSNMSRPKQWRD